jgi:hypothetical protein
MTRRSKIGVIVLVLAIAGFKVTKIAVNAFGVPSCHSTEAIKGMIEAIARPEFGSLAVNNAVTTSGGLLSTTRHCSAEIAPIRGGVDAGDMHWMHVTYQVRKAATPAQVEVTATLGGDTTLAPKRSEMARWAEYFLD